MSEQNVIALNAQIEQNVVIGCGVVIDEGVVIKSGSIIGSNVRIEANTYIDHNVIIRNNVWLKEGSFIGANTILGEYTADFYRDKEESSQLLEIGKKALIRSGSILYSDSVIGDEFQTGHQVTIREKSKIGNHVSVGTLSDIQGHCVIGNYVRLHSNVHIGQLSQIDDYVWIFPYVVLTNDPTPPTEELVGVHVHSFAIIATGAIIMPGMEIGQDCLVGAGAIVTKHVGNYAVAVGNPAKKISDIRKIRNKITGQPVYPWRKFFGRAMPWEEMGFDAWYRSLDISEKDKLKLDEGGDKGE